MIESIKELREKLQKDKIERMKNVWGHKFFNQTPALYITRLILVLKLKITPNQITIIFTIIGILGALLIYSQNFWLKIIAIFLLWLCLILDGVDGDIARYRNTFSLKGLYIDAIYHIIVPPLFFMVMGLSIAKETILINQEIMIILSILGGLSWMIVKINGYLPFHLCCKYYLKNPDIWNLTKFENLHNNTDNQDKKIAHKSLLRRILGIRFQIRQLFFVMFLFLISLVIEKIIFPEINNYPIMSIIIIAYSIFFILHITEEITKSYFSIEKTIGDIGNNYQKKVS